MGSQGSHEFVRSYLVPEFFSGEELPQFQGAFVLDTIMNYNDTAGAQLVYVACPSTCNNCPWRCEHNAARQRLAKSLCAPRLNNPNP